MISFTLPFSNINLKNPSIAHLFGVNLLIAFNQFGKINIGHIDPPTNPRIIEIVEPIEPIWLSDFIREARSIEKPEKHKTEENTIIIRPKKELPQLTP